MLKWVKENKIMMMTMVIFEIVAIALFISTKNLFYLLNFNYRQYPKIKVTILN